jgi:hypothetical protein
MHSPIQRTHCLNRFNKTGFLFVQAAIATLVLNFFATTQLRSAASNEPFQDNSLMTAQVVPNIGSTSFPANP